MSAQTTTYPRMLRINDVSSITGLSRSTFYRNVEANSFPKPVHITRRRIALRELDIMNWFESLEA
ncbi:helix-turn-helix transcriptional regulator [Alkalimarinus alittae]|uniref:AlpA family phage regulatory protein n=1 Tax=Alkalimarinus alittae TaxID=2961619 RepID=A0ABY6N7A1_9ALTE|nr:AlpA family phage regulatory protein [Alkalimarinus alittae]UZE97905.1 AlpA family phage regulatory protein [Alkalimarinus alittae]